MADMESIKTLVRDGQPRHGWRLRSISEEAQAEIQEGLAAGETYFKTALRLFSEGDREGAVAALRHATSSAEKAIEAIEE